MGAQNGDHCTKWRPCLTGQTLLCKQCCLPPGPPDSWACLPAAHMWKAVGVPLDPPQSHGCAMCMAECSQLPLLPPLRAEMGLQRVPRAPATCC